MADPATRCHTCPFRCPGVCDADPSGAMRAACAGAGAGEGMPSDEALVRRHLETAAPATASPCLGALVERHYRYVVAAVCRITGRYDVAHDVAQDVFLKVLVHIDGFRHEAGFTTWLYAIARNVCYDYAKARAARPEVSFDADEIDAPPVDNDALRALDARDSRRLLFLLMRDARLDPIERRALGLHYVAGLPLDAVTVRLALRNRSGAKAPIVSAKRKLDRAVERWERRMERGALRPPLRVA